MLNIPFNLIITTPTIFLFLKIMVDIMVFYMITYTIGQDSCKQIFDQKIYAKKWLGIYTFL